MSSTRQDRRLYHLDNLRSSLIVLVILHHVALIYGAAAPFYYVEPPFNQPVAGTVLAIFVLVNQSWFMGALFLLAGVFTPGTLHRLGPAVFLRRRLVRLGIPILAAIFVLEPLARLGFFLMPANLTGIANPPDWSVYPALMGLGPLWFVALLLLFDTGYALWWRFSAPSRGPVPPPCGPSLWHILALTLGLAAAGFGLRYLVPLGKEIALVFDILNFPTIAYLAQYVGLFLVGTLAGHRGWDRHLTDAEGVWGIAAAVLATIVLFPPAVSGQLFSLAFADPPLFVGHGHWQSAAYALWDSVAAVGLCLGAVVVFRRFFGRPGLVGRFLSHHSYTVYIIHSPILVYLAYGLRAVDLPALAKFGLTSLLAVPVCFAVAALIQRLPLASRVLSPA